jgi:hypothetical protein
MINVGCAVSGIVDTALVIEFLLPPGEGQDEGIKRQ